MSRYTILMCALLYTFVYLRMSYARAVKGKSCHSLHSAAETELRRQLSVSEVRLLDEKFSLSEVENCVEKVNTIYYIYLIPYIFTLIYS